jgi:hypothetical protein
MVAKDFVTRDAKSAAVIHIEPQFWKQMKRLDVIGTNIRFGISVMFASVATFNASKAVSLKNGHSPCFVFGAGADAVILGSDSTFPCVMLRALRAMFFSQALWFSAFPFRMLLFGNGGTSAIGNTALPQHLITSQCPVRLIKQPAWRLVRVANIKGFMTQEEQRQLYYDYRPDNSAWWVKDAPSREPWFEARLAQIGGYHPNGKVNLRVVWGGTEMSDMTYRPQLKYMRTVSIVKGYQYERKDGTVGYLPKGQRMPDEEIENCKNREELVPVRVDHAFGRLRWIIERYCPPEQLKQQGRFENPYAPDGTRVLRDFPREGIYQAFFVVQRRDRTYRDLDNEVLTAVEAMYRHQISEEEAQAGLDAIEEINEKTIIGAGAARGVFAR